MINTSDMPNVPDVGNVRDTPSENVETVKIIESAKSDDPFLAFRKSRMALPETTTLTVHVDVDSVIQLGDISCQEMIPLSPQRLFREEQADLNEDGHLETYTLRDGRLTVILQEGQLLWQSPEEWWIDDFYFGDITNDGRQNLCLSVWREGSYGPYRPFWVEANDTLVRNHLFIYQMETSGENPDDKAILKAVWQSSHLARPNHQAFVAPIDGDGENHLVVVQGDYDDSEWGEIAFWKWNGWGFSPSRD